MSNEPLPLRTRLFALLEKHVAEPIETASDEEIAARRTKRAKMVDSAVGGFVFGRAVGGCDIRDRLVDLGDRELRVRTYRPQGARGALPVVVMFHGGGWVQGNPEQNEWAASRIAVQTPCVVVAPAYRLAPENPFPAAVDDCWDVTRWVHDNAADLGVDADRLSVMGDSAGGNLAAVVAILARDAGGPRLSSQVLIYPGTEMIDRFESEDEMAEAPVLTSKGMRTFSRLYLGGQDGTVVTASPIRAESHADLAPALIQTAGHDPLLDNGRRYADKLDQAGVPVTYSCRADSVHGYLSLPGISPSAPRALDEVVAYLRSTL